MRTSSFAKGRRAADFLRICLGIIISFTLVMGGIVLGSGPAQANIVVSPDPTNASWQECVPITAITFTHGPSANPPPAPGWPAEIFFFWPAGVLPPGVNMDMSTGVLSGCPKPGTAGSSGVYSVGCTALVVFPFSVDFSIPPATVNWSVSNPPPCNMVINPTFYWVAWEGLPYTMTMSVSGGVGPYSWSAVGLPAGLSVTDSANGIISGTPGPATCGIYNVTATVADLGTCCCPPVNRPFIFIVDCWANYPPVFYFTTACDYKVGIGPGLTYGQTNVTVDGSQQDVVAGGGSTVFTSVPCQSHVVMVDQTVPGPDGKTRFTVKGPYYKMVTNDDNYAYFDYAQEVLINTGSEPAGIANPPGSGFYAVGGNFTSSAPSPVTSSADKGIKYIFRSWSLPDGSRNPNRDLVYTVNRSGMAKAEYDTYYLLNLKSNYPPIDESSWELKDSTATYNLSLQPVPMPNLWSLIGGVLRPINGSGSHVMTGPYTQTIEWTQDYVIPVVIILVILLVFIGLVVFLVIILRSKGGAAPATAAAATQPAVTRTAEKETSVKTDSGFCPKCGAPVEKDAAFCKKCGNKLN
jgi:hypothetical protein